MRRKIEMEKTANATVKMVQTAAAAAHCVGDKGRDSSESSEKERTGNRSWASTADCDHSASESEERKANIRRRIMTAAKAAARRRKRQKKKDSSVAVTAAAGSRGRLEPICCKTALVAP